MNPQARLSQQKQSSAIFWTTICLIGAHAILVMTLRTCLAERAASGILLLVIALTALMACSQASRRSCELARVVWGWLAVSIALWATAQALYLINAFYFRSPNLNPNLLLFLFFVSMFPLSAGLMLTRSSRGTSPRWLAWFDIAQVMGMLLAGCLLNISLISGSSFRQIETRLLTLHARNLLLAAALLARAFVSRGRARSLYASISVGFSLFTLSSWIGNQAIEFWGARIGGWVDLTWSIPFAGFAIAATQWQRRSSAARLITVSPNAPSVRRIRQCLAPIALSLCVIALAIMGMPMQKTIAVVLIFASLLCYFTRSALAQRHGNELLAKAQSAGRVTQRFRGYLPLCAACKNIRDESGRWLHLESYIRQHTEAEFTHGICPPCATRLYPEHVS